jgi:hypothetical protein
VRHPGASTSASPGPGWKQIRAEWADDPAIVKESARSDWLELRVDSAEDLARYRSVFKVMLNLNR